MDECLPSRSRIVTILFHSSLSPLFSSIFFFFLSSEILLRRHWQPADEIEGGGSSVQDPVTEGSSFLVAYFCCSTVGRVVGVRYKACDGNEPTKKQVSVLFAYLQKQTDRKRPVTALPMEKKI